MSSSSEDRQRVAEAMKDYLASNLHKRSTIRMKARDGFLPMFFTYEAEEDYYYDALATYEDGVEGVNGSGTAKYALTKQGNAICVRDEIDKSSINLGGSSVVRKGV